MSIYTDRVNPHNSGSNITIVVRAEAFIFLTS